MHVIFLLGTALNHMDLVLDCTMNLFLPKDLCPNEGLSISQTPSLLDPEHPRLYTLDMLLPICASVTPVGL